MSGTLLLIIIPFVINLGLISWAITDLMQREHVRYLSKTGWILVIALIFFGSLIYFGAGRGEKAHQG